MHMLQELGELYSKYQKQGLVILGFPCNQFNGQEPGDNKEIKKFAKSRGAEFPMMSKVEVNGAGGTSVVCALARKNFIGLPAIAKSSHCLLQLSPCTTSLRVSREAF